MNLQRYAHQPERAGAWPNWPTDQWRTTDEAAEALGVSQRRICAMIKSGILPAHKAARMWVIHAKAIEAVAKMDRPPGGYHGRRQSNSRREAQR